MKNKFVVISMLLSLLMSVFVITFHVTPVTFADQTETQKEVWKIVNVTNPTVAYDRVADINITVTSSKGVHIACSTNITEYFENITYWQGLGYTGWRDWLNGTTTLPYHWGEMDWCVSNGSLTSITYDEIQHWGDMYLDSGGGMEYMTFMGNTYMADWNLTATYNDPDIVSTVYWEGNEIRVIDDLLVPANTTIHIVFKIVITEPGAYTFNVESTPGVDVSPLSWTAGGVATLLVPYDYTTIQEAIDSANPDDIIVVDGGTYIEDLSIPETKTNLEIGPVDGASVTIKGVQNVPEASFPLAIPNIKINASGVKIHGFTIEGPNYTSGRYSSGVVIGAPNVEIYNNTFKVTPAATLAEISQAIQTYHKSAQPGVDISGLNIHDNRFMNLSAGAAGYEGIYINLDEGTTTVTVQDNQFGGSVVRAVTTERSKTTISGNTIMTGLATGLPGGYQGINVGGVNTGNVSHVSVTGNIINGSASGKGFRYGIKLGYSITSTFANVSIIGNTIEMNDVGVLVKFSASGVKVNCNNIDGNAIYGVENADTTETVNAAYNWWGDEKGPGNETGSTGDYVSDNVDFKPWLVEPYPPLTPVSIVYVDPQYINLTAPALSTTFEIDVNIANVTLLYGFEFKLRWNDTLLNLDSFESFPEHLWGSYYDVSETMTSGEYSLAISAQSPTPTFNGSATLATLTFRMVYDPVYPENVTCGLDLVDLILGDDSTPEPNPILHLVYNGTYSCNSTIPKLVLMPQDPMAYVVPTEFDVNVNVTNIVNLAAFEFELAYNSTLLEVTSVIVPFSAPIVGYGTGVVSVNVTNISPPLNGSRILVTIRFKAAQGIVWNAERASVNCTLAFSYHEVLAPGDVPIEHSAVNGTYLYKPVPGDLNMDGVVDIIDLAAAANVFGTNEGEPGWFEIADLNLDDTINILDIILIARNFGRTEP